MPRLSLQQLVTDIADALAASDRTGSRHKTYQPGIGPFSEGEAVRAIVTHLKTAQADTYESAIDAA